MPDIPEASHAAQVTVESLPRLLSKDACVKIAGSDVDGILRGKLISKDKFLSVAKDGFGFCSVIFGWDMHDVLYQPELNVSTKENGYKDIIAVPDLQSYRRVPWESDVPFFLVSFFDPDSGAPLCACSRGLLETAARALEKRGVKAMAGAEYEFCLYQTPQVNQVVRSTKKFLQENPAHALSPVTETVTGYSLTRPVENQEYYYNVFETCKKFDCGIEGWHTETGPGVFEAALTYDGVRAMADKAGLFKYVVKALGSRHNVTPSFMAKPREGMAGNSGHMHVSLIDARSGANLLVRQTADKNAIYPDLAHISDLGRHFLAGLLDGFPDVMPLVAPTINSYKRLVENFFAPVNVSWGLEHRGASIRLIAPPIGPAKATRFEVRVPGADANPHLALAAILALGWRGVEKKMDISVPPIGSGPEAQSKPGQAIRLARSLKDANAAFMRKDSVAREVFGDDFVDHYGGTRAHEVRLWDEAVTDWETKRYIEMV